MSCGDLKDLDLLSIECHFGWGLEDVGKWVSDPVTRIEWLISKYNKRRENLVKRIVVNCLMAYIMHKAEMVGLKILLENTAKLLAYSKDSNANPPVLFYPSWGDSGALWSGEWEEFCEEASKIVPCDGAASESEGEEEFNGELKDVLWVAANHVFHFLSTFIGIGGDAVAQQASIVPTTDTVKLTQEMSAAEKASVLIIKAKTMSHVCEVSGLSLAVKLVKQAIRLHPDPRWVLLLVRYRNYIAQQNFLTIPNREEEELILDAIEGALALDIQPFIRKQFMFEKLRILWTSNNFKMRDKGQTCLDLAEELLHDTTNEPWLAVFCAGVISSFGSEQMRKAIAIVEDLLEKHPDYPTLLSRASNLYKKAGNLEKALELAEKASQVASGACWQVLKLKLALGHKFSHERFFEEVTERFDFTFEKAKIHVNAFLFYVCQTDQYFEALSHFERLGVWEKEFSSDLSKVKCFWSKEMQYVNVIEAAYNVSLFVQSLNREDVTTEECALSERVRAVIEEQTGLEGFTVDPQTYIQRLKGERSSAVTGGWGERRTNPAHLENGYRGGWRTSTNTNSEVRPGHGAHNSSQGKWSPARASRQRFDVAHLNYNWRESFDRLT